MIKVAKHELKSNDNNKSINSRSMQVFPIKPAGQIHLNLMSSLKHFAPFLHGRSPHGLAIKAKIFSIARDYSNVESVLTGLIY